MKKSPKLLFSPIFTQPRQIWLFSRVFGPFLPSEMIINIIWDEYGSILTFTFFGFFHFLPFLGIFGHFGHFLHFWVSVGVGGVLGVLLSYKKSRVNNLVLRRVYEWV